MPDPGFYGIELLPETQARQLMILLHGLGTTPANLLPLAQTLRDAFPASVLLLPEGFAAFDGGGDGRQWFRSAAWTKATPPRASPPRCRNCTR
jgi:Phospholipase/Carboxylesterase.